MKPVIPEKILRYLAVGAVAAVSWTYAADLRAQQSEDAEVSDDSADGLGESDAAVLKAAIQAESYYTDNFYYSPSQGRGVLGIVLKPQIAYVMNLPRLQLQADTGAEWANFNSPSEKDNYLDGYFRGKLGWAPAERHRFVYGAALRFDHDAFGTERTAGTVLLNRELDQWRKATTDASYFYGLQEDLFNVQFRLGGDRKQYTTNTLATQIIDYSLVSGGATFLYNMGPKTSWFVDLSRGVVSYDFSAQRNATQDQYLAGVRWQATAKTSGDVRVGWGHRSYRAGFNDLSGLSWQVNIKWAPRVYRKFSLQAGRLYLPSYFSNVSVNDKQFGAVQWTEDLSPKLAITLAGVAAITDYRDTTREDRDYTADLSVRYKLTRNITAVGSVAHEWRNSNVNSIDSKKFTAYLGIRYAI